ncbi:Thioredoxin [Entamoeba marina]
MIADNKTDNSMIEEYTRITDELSLTIDSKFYIANGEFNLYYYSKDGTQQWDQKYPLSWWMNIVCFPLFDVLSDDSADILEFEHNLPVFWYFSNNSDTSRDQIKQLAQQYRYQMLFVEVSSSDIEIDSYGQQIAPSATIIHPNGRTIYPLPTIDAIEQDIKRFFNNEFQPLVRSSSEQEVIAGIVAPQLLRSSWDETLEANPNIIIFVVDSSPYGISLLQRDIAAFMNRTIATTSFKTYWMNGDTDDVPVEVEFSSIPALLVWKDNQFKVFEGEFKQKNLVEFVSKFFEFNPGEEIPEDALPVLIEDDDDIDEGELSDDESDNGIDEEQLQRSSNKEQETLTVKQIQEILKDPFVKKTLKEIKWTKIFDVPKNFNVNNVKQVQQLAKDDTFIELLSPFYKEVHSMKQENKPKKVKKQRDEL